MNETETINRNIICRYFEYVSNNQGDEAADLLHDDVLWILPSSESEIPVPKSVLQERSKLLQRQTAASFRWQPVSYTVEGERVAVEVKAEAILSTGNSYNNDYHFIFIVRDKKIVKVRAYYDTTLTKELRKIITLNN